PRAGVRGGALGVELRGRRAGAPDARRGPRARALSREASRRARAGLDLGRRHRGAGEARPRGVTPGRRTLAAGAGGAAAPEPAHAAAAPAVRRHLTRRAARRAAPQPRPGLPRDGSRCRRGQLSGRLRRAERFLPRLQALDGRDTVGLPRALEEESVMSYRTEW